MDTDVEIDDLDFNSDLYGTEIDHASLNKKARRKAAKEKYRIREKLYSLQEQKTIERELNSFSPYWDM